MEAMFKSESIDCKFKMCLPFVSVVVVGDQTKVEEFGVSGGGASALKDEFEDETLEQKLEDVNDDKDGQDEGSNNKGGGLREMLRKQEKEEEEEELEEGEVKVHADTSSDEEDQDDHICDEEKTVIVVQNKSSRLHSGFKPGDLIAASAVVHKKYRALNIKPPQALDYPESLQVTSTNNTNNEESKEAAEE